MINAREDLLTISVENFAPKNFHLHNASSFSLMPIKSLITNEGFRVREA